MVVLDIVMPGGMDGVQVCKRLRADPNTAPIPILFLTSRAMIEDKIRGFEAGADDYLTKPFAIQELELRVRALLRRAQLPSPAFPEPDAEGRSASEGGQETSAEDSILAVGDLRLNCRTFEVSASDRTVLLTPVEFELLNHLMKYPGQIFSSEQLLQEVWDYPAGTGDPALVRMHIRNLRSKIEPAGADKPAFIQTIVRRGYTIRPVRVADARPSRDTPRL
jgi:DNA-binding response OmpR family regulator